MTEEFTLFQTAIGACAIAWNGRGIGERERAEQWAAAAALPTAARGGIVGVQLPERTEAATRARMQRRFPGARAATPPPDVRTSIDGIAALLRGEGTDLSRIVLDDEQLPEFDRRVYEIARTIPSGATLSYGDVAERLGARNQARDVGQSLARNPFPIIVPCHRVLASGGKAGGFSANGGITMKLRMLAIEGALLTSAT